jgi:hypothetical protein
MVCAMSADRTLLPRFKAFRTAAAAGLLLVVGPLPWATAATAQAGPEVKMSRNGICHVRGSRYYGQTIHYTPYPSIKACINAGGRMPRR